ncbi:hypothetical protein DFH07DRAFT_404609 [Mycena maculata]|uniref:Uncharacterized protein n=1 Tax=Mycena maculata TaxID=230809 RepID=A0AAD7JDV2_9AGAR|nr:hypothetical protein DFH07DRAFT_404609 [Mycena maculata]
MVIRDQHGPRTSAGALLLSSVRPTPCFSEMNSHAKDSRMCRSCSDAQAHLNLSKLGIAFFFAGANSAFVRQSLARMATVGGLGCVIGHTLGSWASFLSGTFFSSMCQNALHNSFKPPASLGFELSHEPLRCGLMNTASLPAASDNNRHRTNDFYPTRWEYFRNLNGRCPAHLDPSPKTTKAKSAML